MNYRDEDWFLKPKADYVDNQWYDSKNPPKSLRERVISAALDTEEGRRALADAMREPIRDTLPNKKKKKKTLSTEQFERLISKVMYINGEFPEECD